MASGARSWEAEFGLALECCEQGFRDSTLARHAVPPGIDWSRFVQLVAFHRIDGLAAAFLAENETDAPPDVRAALSSAAAAIATRNLEAAADCRTLLQAFDDAATPLLFLKGLTLGALAYRNPMMKAAIDIDLLIDVHDLRKAAGVLRDCGYRLAAPRESSNDELLTRWHRGWKESVWTKAEPPLQIDLHTRVSDNARLVPGIGVSSPRQSVDVSNGISLPTLALDECFAFLAVHGASSAWFRLKWISDFAALLHGRTGEEIERLFRRSLELGAGRSAGQALLLADTLFGSLNGAPKLKTALLEDGAVRRLAGGALRMLTREPREPTQSALGSLPVRWTQFFLLPGLGYKLSEFTGQAHRVLNRPPG